MKPISTIRKLISSFTSKRLNVVDSSVQTLVSTPHHLQTNVNGEIYLDIYNRPVHDAEAQFYPPKVNGLSVFCVDAILKRYKNQIIDLENHVDIGLHRTTDEGINLFDARYLSVIRKLAEYVHMLPASEYHHHSQPGGLFRHSLDAALIALRKADNQLPPTVGKVDLDAQRRVRYLYASWVGALLHDTGKILTDMQVSAYTIYDHVNNTSVPISSWSKPIKPWIPQIETLIQWATRNQVERYFVHFKGSRVHKEHVSSGATLLPHILKGEGLEFIMDSPDDLFSNLTSALNGYAHINGYLATAIRFGDSVSTAKDVKTMATAAFGTLKKSRMLSIVDTMRSLKKEWNFNSTKSHAYVIGDCVFIRWQSAFDSILKSARENQFDALPNDTTSLLGMMEDFRIVEPFDNDNRFVLFAIGVFTEQDVINIIDEKVNVSWIELIKVVYREWVYDSDPVHPNLEGLLYLSATNKYFITKEDGSFTELSFDTSTLNEEKETPIENTAELHDKVKINPNKKVLSQASSQMAEPNDKPTTNKEPVSNQIPATQKKEEETPSTKKSGAEKNKIPKPEKPTKANIEPITFENSAQEPCSKPSEESVVIDSKAIDETPAPPETAVTTNNKKVSNDYFLNINNKWYIDVNSYIASHKTDIAAAGQNLLERKLIRQKLGTSSISALVRRKGASSVVCFELTPLGKETLMIEAKTPAKKEKVATSSTKGKIASASEKITTGKQKQSATLSDSTYFEYTTTSVKGSLGATLLAHKLKVHGDREYININLKDLAQASDSNKSNINGVRISKLIQDLKINYSNEVQIIDIKTFTIKAHIQDVSTKEVFK